MMNYTWKPQIYDGMHLDQGIHAGIFMSVSRHMQQKFTARA